MDDTHGDKQNSATLRNESVPRAQSPASTSVLPAKGIRNSTVKVAPITDDDLASVADFLRTNLNDGVPWAQSCMSAPWQTAAPNHGFMLRDGQRVVGTLLALYSERLVDGRRERFCNLGSWCVLTGYRSHSISLLKATLAQEGYNFTVLTPNMGSQEILAWFGFQVLDTAGALIPNFPWPTLPGRTKVSSDPAMIEKHLAGTQLKIYRDHTNTLAARHLVLIRGHDSCHVIWREAKYGRKPVAHILHVGNPSLFHRAVLPLTRHLLARHGLVATLIEPRLVGHKPNLSITFDVWPKMYRSATLTPAQIDYLYSELVCVPW